MKGIIKLIILILFIIIGLFGIYYLTTKVVPSNTNEPEDKTTNDLVVFDANDEMIVNLISRLNITSAMCEDVEYFANDKKVTVSDVTSDKAFNIVMRLLINEAASNNKDIDSTMSVVEFRKHVSKVFGSKYKFDPTSLTSNENLLVCGGYVFDSDTNMFIIPTFGGCGGTCLPGRTTYKIKSAILDENVLTVEVKVVFGNNEINPEGGEEQYYYFKDYKRTQKIPEEYMLGDKLSDAGFEMGSTYEYKFKNENDNYVFVSSELVK